MVVGYCVLLYEYYVSVQNSHSGDVATNDEGGHPLQEGPDQHGMAAETLYPQWETAGILQRQCKLIYGELRQYPTIGW